MRLSQRGTPFMDPAAGSIIHFYHFRYLGQKSHGLLQTAVQYWSVTVLVFAACPHTNAHVAQQSTWLAVS